MSDDGAAGFGDGVSGSAWGLILRDVPYTDIVCVRTADWELVGRVTMVTAESAVVQTDGWLWTVPLEEIVAVGVKDRELGVGPPRHVRAGRAPSPAARAHWWRRKGKTS